MRRCLASLAFILLSLGWGATGRADEAERDQERARSFDDAADRYLTQDRYAESISYITRAQLLWPDPQRLFRLGVAFKKTCQSDMAIEFYERYRRELNCKGVEDNPDRDRLTAGKCSKASNHIAEVLHELHCSEQEREQGEAATIKADLFARAMSLDIRQRSEEALSAYLEFRRQARCQEVEKGDSDLAGQCRDAQVFFHRLAEARPKAAEAQKSSMDAHPIDVSPRGESVPPAHAAADKPHRKPKLWVIGMVVGVVAIGVGLGLGLALGLPNNAPDPSTSLGTQVVHFRPAGISP